MPRERAIPCRGATLKESIAGTHKTWADDGYCDRCRVLAAQSIAMVRANHPTISRRPGSGLSSAPSFPVAAVSARVGVLRTAADAGTFVSESTESPAGAAPSRPMSASLNFGGFLSRPSGGGSMRSQRLADFGRPLHPHT